MATPDSGDEFVLFIIQTEIPSLKHAAKDAGGILQAVLNAAHVVQADLAMSGRASRLTTITRDDFALALGGGADAEGVGKYFSQLGEELDADERTRGVRLFYGPGDTGKEIVQIQYRIPRALAAEGDAHAIGASIYADALGTVLRGISTREVSVDAEVAKWFESALREYGAGDVTLETDAAHGAARAVLDGRAGGPTVERAAMVAAWRALGSGDIASVEISEEDAEKLRAEGRAARLAAPSAPVRDTAARGRSEGHEPAPLRAAGDVDGSRYDTVFETRTLPKAGTNITTAYCRRDQISAMVADMARLGIKPYTPGRDPDKYITLLSREDMREPETVQAQIERYRFATSELEVASREMARPEMSR